jgi:hypothetical protein
MAQTFICETCNASAPVLHQSYDEKKKGAFECSRCALRDKRMNRLQRERIKLLMPLQKNVRSTLAQQKGTR